MQNKFISYIKTLEASYNKSIKSESYIFNSKI